MISESQAMNSYRIENIALLIETSGEITMKKLPYGLALVVMFHFAPAFADDDDKDKSDKAPQAEPFVFV